MKTLLASLVVILLSTTKTYSNVYDYKVLNVIDGDTVTIEAPFLPDELKKTLRLRIVGVDTPEKGGRAKCEKEMILADKAKTFVQEKINSSKKSYVILFGWDKFGGRVIGDLILDGKHLSTLLITHGYASMYNGSGKKKDWCK